MSITSGSFGSPAKPKLFTWWAGELGWLATWFAPILRLRAQNYSEVRISLHPEWNYLVNDFAKTTPLKVNYSSASFWDGEIEEDMEPPKGYEILRPGTLFIECGSREPDLMSRPAGDEKLEPRKWRKLGIENRKKKADILCSFRPPKAFKGKDITAKSYPLDLTEDLVGRLLATGNTVAAIGDMDNYFDSRMIDLRMMPLIDLCGAMRMAKCVVGPSSGPIHIASLSECPVVTWNASNNQQSQYRYTDHLNPFDSPVSFIESATGYKHPEVSTLLDALGKYTQIS